MTAATAAATTAEGTSFLPSPSRPRAHRPRVSTPGSATAAGAEGLSQAVRLGGGLRMGPEERRGPLEEPQRPIRLSRGDPRAAERQEREAVRGVHPDGPFQQRSRLGRPARGEQLLPPLHQPPGSGAPGGAGALVHGTLGPGTLLGRGAAPASSRGGTRHRERGGEQDGRRRGPSRRVPCPSPASGQHVSSGGASWRKSSGRHSPSGVSTLYSTTSAGGTNVPRPRSS